MSIVFDKQARTLNLTTASSSYQMRIDDYGFVRHLHYGSSTGNQDMAYQFIDIDHSYSGNPIENRIERNVSLDVLPQEYTSFGVGDFRVNSIAVVNRDGSRAAAFTYVGHEIKTGKYEIPGLPAVYDNGGEADTLILTMQDEITGLTVRLYYGVFEKQDVITRCTEIVNMGSDPVTLEKAASLSIDFTYGNWDLIHFTGKHCMERQPERQPVGHNLITVGSDRGMSSHQQNPFIILCDHDADEDRGECVGFMLAYSGGFRAEVEKDQYNSVRVVMGISEREFTWALQPGESFFTPEVIMAYADGLAALSHKYHKLIHHNLCRGEFKLKRRPVLINSWEANYFNFNEESLCRLAKEAQPLGVELFVMDDGWFGHRNDDNTSLGDWYINREKLPDGLGPLIAKINGLGMKFGIWVEPEMISADSDLCREHPDWVLAEPGRIPTYSRGQLVLDMSRKDVVDHLYDIFSALLRENNIAYVKWDFNRSVCNFYSNALPPERQGEVAHRFVLGLYDLLERLTSEFPQVLFEGCAGGGGRFDAGMLYYTPQIWTSDDTDAIHRLAIQRGTSFGYPVSTMGAHVSAVPNHQTGRITPFETRGIVASSGQFGYELDLAKLDDWEKEEVRRQIALYHEDEDVIHNGLYYRLTDPEKQPYFAAWQMVSEDQAKSLVNIVIINPQPNPAPLHIRLKGLDPDARYRIEEDVHVCTGAALMNGGYTFPPMKGDYPAAQLHLIREEK